MNYFCAFKKRSHLSGELNTDLMWKSHRLEKPHNFTHMHAQTSTWPDGVRFEINQQTRVHFF